MAILLYFFAGRPNQIASCLLRYAMYTIFVHAVYAAQNEVNRDSLF